MYQIGDRVRCLVDKPDSFWKHWWKKTMSIIAAMNV